MERVIESFADMQPLIVWDDSIHNYKLTDTAEDEDADGYEQYLFTVRRQFDWKGKYTDTVVDIKSQTLKEALQEVMEGVKGVSLVEDTPTVRSFTPRVSPQEWGLC